MFNTLTANLTLLYSNSNDIDFDNSAFDISLLITVRLTFYGQNTGLFWNDIIITRSARHGV